MRLKLVKLGDIATPKGGKRLPKGFSLVDTVNLHPYIRARDIRDGKITFTDPVYVPNEAYEKISRYTVNENDVCITIVGANVGDVGIVPEELDGANLTENAVKLQVCENLCDAKYLGYYLQASKPQNQMKFFAAGAAQPKLGLYKIKALDVSLPSLNAQEIIASILSAYDDLIENNLKRIKLLEEAAQLLYLQWFVDFKFPGYEDSRFVKGVPEGWSTKLLREVCQLTMGQSPKSIYYNQEGKGLPFHQGVTCFGSRFVSHETYCSQENRIAEPGDILCSVRAPVGRLNISLDKIVIGRGLSAIRNRHGFQSFQYCQLKSYFFRENIIGSGAIFASVTKKQMESIPLLTPADTILSDFEGIVKIYDEQITNLFYQNQRLKEVRDILLPRLMDGSIEV